MRAGHRCRGPPSTRLWGEETAAFEQLEQALSEREPGLALVMSWAEFMPLYGHPRFEELQRGIWEGESRQSAEVLDHISRLPEGPSKRS